MTEMTEMSEEPTTFERVRKVIVERFKVKVDAVTEDTKIFDLCHGRCDWYNVLVDCEHEFQIGDISDDDIEATTGTVRQLVDIIDQKIIAETTTSNCQIVNP